MYVELSVWYASMAVRYAVGLSVSVLFFEKFIFSCMKNSFCYEKTFLVEIERKKEKV
jgi:hypothetical protein